MIFRDKNNLAPLICLGLSHKRKRRVIDHNSPFLMRLIGCKEKLDSGQLGLGRVQNSQGVLVLRPGPSLGLLDGMAHSDHRKCGHPLLVLLVVLLPDPGLVLSRPALDVVPDLGPGDDTGDYGPAEGTVLPSVRDF
jgi:hypothetical protein